MSYDDRLTDPEYYETRREYRQRKNNMEAIRMGYGEYDRPYEAQMCAIAHTKYRGKRYGEPFVGYPTKDYPDDERI